MHFFFFLETPTKATLYIFTVFFIVIFIFVFGGHCNESVFFCFKNLVPAREVLHTHKQSNKRKKKKKKKNTKFFFWGSFIERILIFTRLLLLNVLSGANDFINQEQLCCNHSTNKNRIRQKKLNNRNER